MPILIGISFNCVQRTLKGASYGINSLMCTFLGNLLAPSVYGYLNDTFKMKDKRMAMRCVMNYIWVNLIYLILCAIFRYRKKDDIPIEEKPDEGKEMEEKE
jgi:sugar phosphate permease